MQIEIVVTLDVPGTEQARVYARSVDRPYLRVPTANEFVSLDDGEGTRSAAIDEVSWSNDGSVVFDIELTEDVRFVTAVWLEANGYQRIDRPALG